MDDEDEPTIDHPERLCRAILGIIDELEGEGIVDTERAAELRSAVYRSIDIDSEEEELG